MKYNFQSTNIYLETRLRTHFIWIFDVSGRKYVHLNEHTMFSDRSKIKEIYRFK
jgi:hypothetical protein